MNRVITALFLLAVVCVAFVVTASVHEGVTLQRERRTISTKAPVFECSKNGKNIEKYYETKNCCNETIPAPFSKDDITKCKKSLTNIKPNDKYITSYQLFELQDKSKDNIIDFTTDPAKTKLFPTACLAECLFNASTLFASDGTVDTALLTTLFQTKTNETWDPILAAVIEECKALIVEPAFPKTYTVAVKKVDVTCKTYPLFFMQCIYFSSIGQCPVDNEPKLTDKNKKIYGDCAEGTKVKGICGTIFTTTTAAPA